MTRILIIEDEELIRESLEDLLLAEGFEVITADNGQQGINLANQQQPHLILCDVMMPILNGYEVLSQLRQNKELDHVPFLFLTSLIDRQSSRKGMSLGADDYLEKPCTKDELLAAIAVRLGKQEAIKVSIKSQMEALRTSIALSLPHEFHTPLSGIMSLAELMMMQSEDLQPAEVYEYAEDIHHSSKRLQRVIQNYLLYSRLIVTRSRGETRFTAEDPCNSQILIQTLGERRAKMYDRLEDLELDLVDFEILIAADDLIKIVDELIDNAFKYSVKGSKVRLSSHISDHVWLFNIQDYGRGISKQQISSIGAFIQFNRQFYEQQGMGLGLSIAQTLIEFYGGELKIDSQENIGTNLQISIPCDRNLPPTEA
ncbi:hybrid sensor histidine kinase/response regulator [Pseudanabaena mucicola]|uniref:histidine kinase n=1 Tax=Pseudanabaena mucicola FACHB-723 TaxID=2692860 RepID=A0ABR7ZRT8_9CYAN|nr:hybrid sensor histidine kinase/response regulator [Pseudanabaena mucicola]MBD2186621.1 hybrid sensor histidine kinase/response regulator [Pseudanabaena mucicola FACHB-723]